MEAMIYSTTREQGNKHYLCGFMGVHMWHNTRGARCARSVSATSHGGKERCRALVVPLCSLLAGIRDAPSQAVIEYAPGS